LFEKNVVLGLSDVYSKLKASLIKNGCKIVAEEVPTQISIVQGSVWGVSPKAAKKNINFRLSESEGKTHVLGSSVWTQGYKMLTLVGSVLSATLLLLCVWIFLSINSYISTFKTNYWSWLASSQGFMNLQKAHLFINLTEVIVVFLAISLIAEIIVVAFAHSKIDSFALETLEKLT
jgi:hypothetical protein